MTIDGQGSSWTNSDDLHIGYLGEGTLRMTNGGVLNSGKSSIGGGNSMHPSLVTIDGAGSRWTNQSLSIGAPGQGSLKIANGGAVISAESIIGDQGSGELNIVKGGSMESALTIIGNRYIGEVVIEDSGSLLSTGDLSVGYLSDGRGELLVRHGGTVSSQFGYVGANSRSIGRVSVLGSGAQWLNKYELFVGDQGNGSLVVDHGGSVKSDRATIGNVSGGVGEASINGQGSTWTVRDRLMVGNQGSGTLNVENGGKVESASAVIGNALGGLGTVMVNGDGSQWRNQGDLLIGRGGKGLLNIENQGLVSVGGRLRILSTGLVNLNGGTLEVVNQDDVRPAPGGRFNWLAGTLSITGADGVTLGTVRFLARSPP
ncbi:hypothetical protein [Methylomonas koyamae]|uniref:hypothetical protein n=1 Tax=Methylomonas koyamae TaxID=702114 RepID=UPI000A51A3C8|nr:hypothetical protein [Methylomonas koyamae]